ncbi:hypothetical protein [Propionivibrio sp.]|uniref:hypothetical protein n=1 Tax=Propionivibrio sp. TaxID=2212460 RepID=UPI003BF375B9
MKKIHFSLISSLVTPAKAGVQFVYLIVFLNIRGTHWIPACAGMTVWKVVPINSRPER